MVRRIVGIRRGKGHSEEVRATAAVTSRSHKQRSVSDRGTIWPSLAVRESGRRNADPLLHTSSLPLPAYLGAHVAPSGQLG